MPKLQQQQVNDALRHNKVRFAPWERKDFWLFVVIVGLGCANLLLNLLSVISI